MYLTNQIVPQRVWMTWVNSNWGTLTSGGRVAVPGGFPHPSLSGFEKPPMAEPDGQVDDWVLSLTDGSRIHVHVMPNGQLIAHRDATDPKGGLLPALWHWATESKSGRLAVVVGAAVLIAKALNQDEEA